MNISNSNNTAYPSTGTAKRAAWSSFLDFLGQGIKILEHILLVPLFCGHGAKLFTENG